MAKDLVLMGPPGSGKGTQARLLVDRDGWYQLSTGDLFRFHLANGTPLGKLAKGFMDRGEYVPDEVTVDMVREKLAEIPAATPVVFDGFPRTVVQAEALEGLLRERVRTLGSVALIDVPHDELVARLSARATCAKCQTVYSLAVRAPKVAGVCDRCGGPVSATARTDESPEVVRRRLDVYDAQTKPVVDHYRGKGLVRPVDGVGSMSEIFARLLQALPS